MFHEVAHGWVAYRLGDSTAARMGRLTLNPIPHIDLFGTIVIPLLLIVAGSPFLFGYAKPVPVNYNNLNRPKRDMVWVALAGPVTNLLLALASVFCLKAIVLSGLPEALSGSAWTTVADFLVRMALSSIRINVFLAVFNLLPIPPLDGGRVLVGLLPHPQAAVVAKIEPFGFVIIVLLLMTDVLDNVMGPAVRFVLGVFSSLL